MTPDLASASTGQFDSPEYLVSLVPLPLAPYYLVFSACAYVLEVCAQTRRGHCTRHSPGCFVLHEILGRPYCLPCSNLLWNFPLTEMASFMSVVQSLVHRIRLLPTLERPPHLSRISVRSRRISIDSDNSERSIADLFSIPPDVLLRDFGGNSSSPSDVPKSSFTCPEVLSRAIWYSRT